MSVWKIAIVTAVIVWVALFIGAAFGQQSRGEWFESLKIPGSDVSCCDVTDCRATEAHYYDGAWHADINGVMTKIPESKILFDKQSIDGEAYVCASPTGLSIYCFVRPNMGF